MDLTILERAAETLLAPPNLVSAEDRKHADAIIEEFKKKVSIRDCLMLLHQSKNSFILFQIGQAIGEILLRDWALVEKNDVEMAYKTLLEFVATSPGIEPFVVGAFLKSAAMIIKRGILDGKSGNQEELYQFVNSMLTNESSSLQAAGCLFISALIEQFSSAWGNSKYSITWDFHMTAKNEFEDKGLRRLLEMSLTTLHALSNQDNILENDFTRRLCDRFLEVSENVLSWNFPSRFSMRAIAHNQTSASFRPPSTWEDLFANEEFFTLFFKLHAKIRHDEELCTKSMNCLVQLSSFSGDCLPFSKTVQNLKFMTMFITNLLDLFPQGPSPIETSHFCLIINRIFTFRPLVAIMAQEAGLRTRFLEFLKDYTVYLTGVAMNKAIGEAEHEDHASLALIYEAYVELLKGAWKTRITDDDTKKGGSSSTQQSTEADDAEADEVDAKLIKWPVLTIINTFFVSVLSPPQGNRPTAKEEDYDCDDTEDRTLFLDLFNPLRTMICYNVAECMQMMTITLRKSFFEFTQMATGTADISRLPAWQEDQHWLMLIMANSVIAEDEDGACRVLPDVYHNTQILVQNNGKKFCDQKKMQFLQLCMEAPTQDRSQFDQEVDPFILMMGELFAWSAIEHDLFTNGSREMTSPELCRSTLFALRRFTVAVSNSAQMNVWSGYQAVPDEELPLIPENEEFSKIFTRFVVQKVLGILMQFKAEEKLCKEAIDVLLGLVESRAAAIAGSPELFQFLNTLNIAEFPSRGTLMKALVLIGAAANNADLQENMLNLILVPIVNRFKEASEMPSRTDIDSQILDCLQCFSGVANASQSHSAEVLAKFLYGVLAQCVPLMQSRAHSDTIVHAILQLVFDITTKVSIYLDEEAEMTMMCGTFLRIIECYTHDQIKRFTTLSADDDRAVELVMFMDILSNILQKDFLTSVENGVCSPGAKTVIASLQMLMTLMNENMLQMPEVASKFFRLILYLVDFSPESVSQMSPELIESLCRCIRVGITGQYGADITANALVVLGGLLDTYGTVEMKAKCSMALVQQFKSFIPDVFECCLANTCEANIYTDAVSALFSVIAFEKSFFQEYVADLLSKKSNENVKKSLEKPFEVLLLVNYQCDSRRSRVAFRETFDRFLYDIQGLLTCS